MKAGGGKNLRPGCALAPLREEETDIEPIYLEACSTSPLVGPHVDRLKPDLGFIDGDHGLRGAIQDQLLVRSHASIIVHHYIHSQACPDTTLLWKALKEFEAPGFDAFEFTSQYPSVNGSFLGIGAMKRRSVAITRSPAARPD